MKQRIRGAAVALFIAVSAAMTMSACKENTIINASVVPTVDNIHTFQLNDTDIKYTTRTVYDDSTVTSYNSAPVIGAFGTVNSDPFFGITNAGFYFSVIPPNTSFSFPVAASDIDSVVLILPYSGFTWGDTLNMSQTQHLTVYRMTDSMSYDTAYYSFRKFGVDRANPLGSATFNVAGLKNNYISTDTLEPHVRVKLSDNFKQQIFDSVTQYTTYPDFLHWFKGLYVEPDTNQAGTSLVYFRLDGTDHYNTASILFFSKDSVMTSFSYNTSYCSHSSWVSRRFGGYPIEPYYAPADTNAQMMMIQNEPGAAGDVRITNLAEMSAKMGKALINKAQIVLTKIDVNASSDPNVTDSRFTEPAIIFPSGVDKIGQLYTIADRLPLSSSGGLDFIDGKARTVTIGAFTVTQYQINFPRELQQSIVQGRSELHLHINGTQTYPAAYRLIAGGKNFGNGTYKMGINIIYSKIN